MHHYQKHCLCTPKQDLATFEGFKEVMGCSIAMESPARQKQPQLLFLLIEVEFQKWLSLHRSRDLIVGAFKFNKDITKPNDGKLVSEIQMETILFNDNQQHTPREAVTKLMPAIFLRELSSETVPPGLTWAPDPEGAEQAAEHPPSRASSPASRHSTPAAGTTG